MDGKDFPGIAVRIREPQLILARETTGDVVLDLFENTLFLQALLPAGDLLGRLNLDAQVIHHTDHAGG
jgi:hypothetical protein